LPTIVQNLVLGSVKRRVLEKKLRYEDQEFGCDMLCPIHEPKWKNPGKKRDQP
jgi:hypothetical protein